MAGEVAGTLVGIFLVLFLLIWITILIGTILLIIFWIFMIIDVAKRKFKQESDKTMWILIVILAGWIGAIIYYFMIKRPNKH